MLCGADGDALNESWLRRVGLLQYPREKRATRFAGARIVHEDCVDLADRRNALTSHILLVLLDAHIIQPAHFFLRVFVPLYPYQ